MPMGGNQFTGAPKGLGSAESMQKVKESVPSSTTRAVFTDSQFWVPVAVLALGILLLIYLH